MIHEIDGLGNKKWHNAKGELHRNDDFPAIEFINGEKNWYVNGKRHRDNEWHIYNIKHTYKKYITLIKSCKIWKNLS